MIKGTEGRDRDFGTPRVYGVWIVYDMSTNPINDPLVKSPIARLSIDRYKIYCFFRFRGVYKAHIRSNYA